MRVPRLHVDQLLAAGTTLQADRELSHYVLGVLRLRSGADCTVFNSRDGEFAARLEAGGRQQLFIHLGEMLPCPGNPALPVHLGLGLSRGERMDYAVQKSTELGVSEITPLFTERCEVKLDGERAEHRRLHWHRIAVSASEQCGRSQVPVVHAPMPLQAWLIAHPAGIVLDGEASLSPRDLTGEQVQQVLIGPEGGLSDSELSLAVHHGYVRLRLGPRTLRAETAPVAVLSVLQLLFGDF